MCPGHDQSPLAAGLTIDQDALADLCRRHGISAIRVFGSALGPHFGPDSDADILIEFRPGVDPDLFDLGAIQQDLSDLLAREVDLKTPEMFSPASLERVLRASRLGYAAYPIPPG
ncbi:MAG: nucleotidyltransferase family protein [Phycisphaerales bacterium]|nr:nucleotidyltransferase family protein [Phycisphaerales bacterium]